MLCGDGHEMRRNRSESLEIRGAFGKTQRLIAIRVLAHRASEAITFSRDQPFITLEPAQMP
jgi:hypothetical protein